MHKQLDLLSKGSLHEKPMWIKLFKMHKTQQKKLWKQTEQKKELSLNCKHRMQWYHEGGLVQESWLPSHTRTWGLVAVFYWSAFWNASRDAMSLVFLPNAL